MSKRRPDAFRFRPPRCEVTRELAWVLARAFAVDPIPVETPDPQAALALADALGLSTRIAARTSDERLGAELGAEAASAWRRVRAQTTALELRLDAALSAAAAVCARSSVPFALLKGRALVLGGFAAEGSRPASDVDLLIPEDRLRELQRAFEAGGFRNPGNPAYEHQAPLLRHSGGGAIELHRTIPGLRLDGRSSATFAALEAAEELRPVPTGPLELGPAARLPAREVLIAHALVHTLAQHAFAAAHPGFQLVADLVDLGCASVTATLASVGPWIERDVSAVEAGAALELADALAAGDLRLLATDESPASLLAAHFVAGATDPDYAEALKGRLFEQPLSDRPSALARLLLLARTLAPPPGAGPLGWLRRPFDLAGRWRAARRAGRG